MLVFYKNLSLSGQIFGLISSFLSNRLLWVVLDGKSAQEYPVKARVRQGSILSPTFFLLNTLMTFLMILSVILVSMLMILLSTVNVIRHLICGNK